MRRRFSRLEPLGSYVSKALPDRARKWAVAGGQASQLAETASGVWFALAIGILVAYMVLASQFNSYLHPTTVLTILRNLEAKDFVSHEEEGRAHRYRARVAQQVAQKSALSRIVKKFFAGSPEALLAHLVDEHDVDATELRRLAKTIAKREKKGGAR